MADNPIQFVVAAFQDEYGADAVLDALKKATRDKVIKIQNAAVLRRDPANTLHIKETGDMHGGRGALSGGVVGAVAGILAGPILIPVAAGAVIGGLAAKLRDSGFSDARLKQLGEQLQPGTSAIVAVIEHTWVSQLEQMLVEAGADVVTDEIGADIAAELEAGHDVALSAVVDGDAAVAVRYTQEHVDVTSDAADSASSDAPTGSGTPQ